MRDPDETPLDPIEVLTEAEAWAPDAQEGLSPTESGWVENAEQHTEVQTEPDGATASLGSDGLELEPNQAPDSPPVTDLDLQ